MIQNTQCSELDCFKHAGIWESFGNLVWRCGVHFVVGFFVLLSAIIR